ncbi:MAG TPA: hypothetical protein VE959_13790 [Bryobacteraceae bacterium]|nr:hypothetical protein [Bryobacteraceae bacterium]
MGKKASALILLVSTFCFAGDKKPPRQLTDEGRQTANNVAVNQISRELKALSTARYAPTEEAVLSDGKGSGRWQNSIRVRLYVDAQNSYGAMLRNVWNCRVGPERPDSLQPCGLLRGKPPIDPLFRIF